MCKMSYRESTGRLQMFQVLIQQVRLWAQVFVQCFYDEADGLSVQLRADVLRQTLGWDVSQELSAGQQITVSAGDVESLTKLKRIRWLQTDRWPVTSTVPIFITLLILNLHKELTSELRLNHCVCTCAGLRADLSDGNAPARFWWRTSPCLCWI